MSKFTKEVFLLERVSDTMQENSFYKLPAADAEKLINEGKAVDAKEIQQIRKIDEAADNLVDAYKKAVNYIRNSDEPRIKNVPGQAEYEIEQIKDEFDKEIHELENLKAQAIDQFYEEAMREKANALRYIPSADKEASHVLITQLINEVKFGFVQNALNELKEQINYMTTTRKKAVLLEFSKFVEEVEKKAESASSDTQKQSLKRQLREIYSQLTNIHDSALIKAKMAETLKDQGATFTSYRILKLTHRTYSNQRPKL